MSARPVYERVYRALLRLLPADFRAAFEQDMTEDFRDQRHDAATRGAGRSRRLWVQTIGGLLWLATREHLGAISRDVRHAVRLFRRRPAFTLTTVLTLTAGIGVTTATFSIVQAIVLQQIPGPDSERLVSIFEVGPAPDRRQGPVSNANFVDWKPQVTTLDGLALYYYSTGIVRVDGAPAEELRGLSVSDDFLQLTSLSPRLGRLFIAEDFKAWHAAYATKARSTPPSRVIVLSERTWQRVFGGRADIVGTTVHLGEEPVEVIGVMADHPLLRVFTTTLGPAMDYWEPGGAWSMIRREARNQQAMGRLSPGVSLEQAQAQFDGIASRLESAYPEANTGWTIRLIPLREAVTARVTAQLLLLLWASIGVALIAMLNVARLLSTLNEGRRHEFLTRLALGASRFELSRQAITESLVLSVVGGSLGVLLAWLMLPVIVASAPGDIPRLSEVAIHPQTMGFALGLTLVVGVVCGLASHLMTPDRLVTGAQFSARRSTWVPPVMLGAQVAIALVLAIGTTMLVRSMQQVASEPLGFYPENVVASTISLPRSVSRETHWIVQQMVDRLEAHPAVVAAASGPRPLGALPGNALRVKDQPGEAIPIQVAPITTNYFLTIGATVSDGRGFAESDMTGSPVAAVLNAQAVRALGLGANAVGKEAIIDTFPVVIVGVINDIRQALEAAPRPTVYVPANQYRSMSSGQLLVRTNQASETVMHDLRAIISEVEPRAAVIRTLTMEERLRDLTAPRRFILQLVSTFSVLAIVLAVIGLAGVVAESVSQRVREIGIRMALGARSGAIIAIVVRQGIRVITVGAIAGLAIAYQLRTTLEGFVYGVTTTDVWSYGAATAAVVFAGLIACYLPARRATSIDPVIALRRE